MRSIVPALLLSACAAPTIEWKWAPDDLLKAPPQSEYKNHSAVYLLKERRTMLISRWRQDSFTQWHQHDVLAILNEKGFKYADVRVPYRAEGKFVRFEARTVNPDGTIIEVTPARVYDDELLKSEEEEGNNYKARVFSFPQVKAGSVLEYQYILEEPLFYTSITGYLNDKLPVKRYQLSIVGTNDSAYKIKAYNTAVPFKTETSGEYWIVDWTLEDLPATPKESYRLGRSFTDPWYTFVVTTRAKYSYSADYYTDWDHALRFKGDDLYYDNTEYYEGFAPAVDFSGCTDKVCRIGRAIDHLTANYPFRGWHSWPGRNAKEATDAKRASGIEKNRLLWWILKQQQIDAKFAFVNLYHTDYRDPTHPNADAGNHLILRVEKQEGVAEPLWVDAACEYCKPGEIPVWLKDAEAMVVHASKPPPSLATQTKVEVVKVEGPRNFEEGYDFDYRLDLDAAGQSSFELRIGSRGRSCMDAKNETLEHTDEKWLKLAQRTSRKRYQTAELISSEPMKRDGFRCSRTIKFKAPGYVTLDAGRLLVPLTALNSRWDREMSGDSKRELQIAFRNADAVTETLRIAVPPGFEPVRLPAERSASAKGVTVKVTVQREPDAVVVVRSLQLSPGLYAPKNYPAIESAMKTFSSVRLEVIELGPKS